MYLEHFGLRDTPFRITPQTDYFYPGANRGPILEALGYALTHDAGIVVVSGEVGVGKTMLCRMLIERLPADTIVIYIANPNLTPSELLQTIGEELSLTSGSSTDLSRKIERALIALHAEGKRVITVIDEAHAMPAETLEQVRLLSNLETKTHKLMQPILFGQPELDKILADARMRSLRERVTQYFRLKPLDKTEVARYVDFRLRSAGYKGPPLFTGRTATILAKASQGFIRRIHILADKALLAAYSQNSHTVTVRHVKAATLDAGFPTSNKIPWQGFWAATIIAMVLGAGAALFQAKITAPVVETSVASGPARNLSTPAATDSAFLEHNSQLSNSTEAEQDRRAKDHLPEPQNMGPKSLELLRKSRAQMATVPDTHWFIQLQSIPGTATATMDRLTTQLEQSLGTNAVRLYVAKDDPKQHIGVIYGDYASFDAARAELEALPAWVRASSPFLRQYRSLH